MASSSPSSEKIIENGSLEQLLAMLTSKELDADAILHEAVQQICEVLETEYCLAFELDEEKETLHIWGGTGYENHGQDLELRTDHSWDVTYTFNNRKPIIINDYRLEEFTKVPMLDPTIRSGANVLIKGSENVYGVLGVYSDQPGYFTEPAINFLQVTAVLLGTSIERKNEQKSHLNATKSFQDRITHIKDLQRKILRTNMYERWELGNFLHEEIAQDLLATDLLIRSMVQKLEEQGVTTDMDHIENILSRVVKNAKETHQRIVPIDVEEKGAFYAFKKLISHVEETYGVTCDLGGASNLDQFESVELATHLYRMAQETVKNAILYREAEHISMTFNNGNGMALEIKDDGKTFSSALLKGGVMGIGIIEHQIEILGGSLNVAPNPSSNQGLKVILKVPKDGNP